MAHARPWYKRSGSDFVMGALSFPDNDHRYAYSAIIDMLNDRDAPLPDLASFICGFTALSKRKWMTVRQYLLDGEYLCLTPDGKLTNPRFERERIEREKASQVAKENGAKGGRQKAENAAAAQAELELSPEKHAQESLEKSEKSRVYLEKKSETDPEKSNDINETGLAPPVASRAGASPRQSLEIREEEEIEGERAPCNYDVRKRAAQAAAAAGIALSPHRYAHFEDQLAAVTEWSGLGLDWDTEIIPTLAADLSKQDKPRHSLAYFNNRFAQMAARKAQPHDDTARPAVSQNPMVRALHRSEAGRRRQ